MAIDPSSFHSVNVTDTCAVWNVLSSRTLYTAARLAGVVFVCTGFVVYECLFKPRNAHGRAGSGAGQRRTRHRREPATSHKGLGLVSQERPPFRPIPVGATLGEGFINPQAMGVAGEFPAGIGEGGQDPS